MFQLSNTMELIVDNRESTTDYYKNLGKSWITFENLDLGDYIFKYKGQIVCVIERKTIEDMASSINDGRYREQKARLLENFQKNQIIYLIEGDLTHHNLSFEFNKVSKETIYSALVNLYLRDNFNVFISSGLKETYEFMEYLGRKLEKQGLTFLEKKYTKEMSLFHNMKSSKKNLTPRLVYKLQLSSIPGISTSCADAIIQIYPTLTKFILAFNTLESTERVEKLKNIQATTSTGKKRKIGIKVAQNIETYLFSPDKYDPSLINTTISRNKNYKRKKKQTTKQKTPKPPSFESLDFIEDD